MADTPRVTVLVEDLAQEIRRVDGNHDLGAGALAEALMPFLSSRLSAAPAPEGGAVSIWSDARSLFVRYAELFAMTERYEEASAIADKAAREIEAITLRAQPQAREDALRGKGEELVKALKRYGFPVSGAAAVNLGAFGSSEAMAVDFTTREFIQALAALQAEQGAK